MGHYGQLVVFVTSESTSSSRKYTPHGQTLIESLDSPESLHNKNNARMSYSCKGLVFQGFDSSPLGYSV